MSMKIITNNTQRDILFGHELTEKERKEFDYIDADDIDCNSFFRYKGQVYDLMQFMRVEKGGELANAGWHGYHSDSMFSGVLVKYPDDNSDLVIVGRYIC